MIIALKSSNFFLLNEIFSSQNRAQSIINLNYVTKNTFTICKTNNNNYLCTRFFIDNLIKRASINPRIS